MTQLIYNSILLLNNYSVDDIIKSNDSCSSNILKLNKVECRTSNNTPYKVIKYDKKKLSYDC